jgi:carbonic anhydrase
MRSTRVLLAALLLAAPPLAAQSTAHRTMPAPAWGYTGARGSAHWGGLSPAFAGCDTGRWQSPIVLPPNEPDTTVALTSGYVAATGPLYNDGHTVKMNVSPGSWIQLGGERYLLREFHFHHPAEHLVSGHRFPAEIHLVHYDAAGRAVALGIFVQEGPHNRAWDALLAALPHTRGDTVRVVHPVDLNLLMGLPGLAGQGLHTYLGSLTTPPCTQGVRWLVRERRVVLSASQIDQIRRAMPENARPPQPLHGRRVYVVKQPGR